MEYINYHKNNKMRDWNIHEPDCNGTHNALTYNFSNIFESDELNSRQQIGLFKCLIDEFLKNNNDDALDYKENDRHAMLWPQFADSSMIKWLWNQVPPIKSISTDKMSKLKIVLEEIARMIHIHNYNTGNHDNIDNIDLGIINEINHYGWTYFLQPFNSVKCFTYFVQSIMDPNNLIKIDNINHINHNGETVFIELAKQKVHANSKTIGKKCDQLLSWLYYEFSVASANVIKFINIKDQRFDATAIDHAINNENYYMVESILQKFGQHVKLIDEQGSYIQTFQSAWSRIIAAKRVELIRLAVAAMISVSADDPQLTVINKKTLKRCVMGTTPLFWALNNQWYNLLHLMLSSENVNLNPMVTDVDGNSIWEHVTGFSNGTREQFGYSINCVDIVSMKLLIEKHKINVNTHDSFGNQAWYRICNVDYNVKSNAFDMKFNKQCNAAKLLFENNAIVNNSDRNQQNLNVWEKILLVIQENKL